MYNDRESHGLEGLFDGLLWAIGESKAKRITARMAKIAAKQNMILGSIMVELDQPQFYVCLNRHGSYYEIILIHWMLKQNLFLSCKCFWPPNPLLQL